MQNNFYIYMYVKLGPLIKKNKKKKKEKEKKKETKHTYHWGLQFE